MGVYLSQPITQVKSKQGQGEGFEYCMSEMQGWRKNMQDASIYQPKIQGGNSLFAVFDGHGGPQVSKFVEENYKNILVNLELYKKGQYQKALVESFKLIDELIFSEEGQKRLRQLRGAVPGANSHEKVSAHTGCTANVVLITKDHYIVANAGDSRSVLCRSSKKVDLSFDHKPENQIEIKRIEKAGGTVSMGRVNGGLNLSRSLGDFDYKANATIEWHEHMITSCPDVKKEPRNFKEDEFIIIGCDGIWQKYVEDSQGLIDLISGKIKQKKSDNIILQEMLHFLLATDTKQGQGCDNMTSILIRFKNN